MSSGSFFRRPAVLLILALCSLGAVVTIVGHFAGGSKGDQKRTQFSTGGGAESYPAFSPDGKRLAYSRRDSSPDAAFHIYARPVSGGAEQQLTSGAGSDIGPSWSPDGALIAFLRVTRGQGSGECMVVPAGGGTERKVADCGSGSDAAQPLPAVAWSPDGKSLVVVQGAAIATVPLAGGAGRRLTQPPEGSPGDATPAVSPRGGTIAFVRASGSEGADVFVSAIDGGTPRRLTFDDRRIRGIAFTQDGREVIYAADRGDGWSLWRLSVGGGNPREVQAAGRHAQYPAIAAKGTRLAYTDSPNVSAIWRATLGKDESATEERPLIRSTGREYAPAYSPDGKRIAAISGQTGNDEIWIGDADGGNRVQVTKLTGARVWPPVWSPDGRKLLFEVRRERGPEVNTVPADLSKAAEPTRVLLGSGASWSRDGKSIYYQSRGGIWKANAEGGNPQPVETESGASWPEESADGKYILYRREDAIWRVPVAGGKPEVVVRPSQPMMYSAVQAARNGIYYLGVAFGERSLDVWFFDYASGKSRTVLRMRGAEFGPRARFSVSPDGKYILYPRMDQSETDLVLVENFR